MAPADSAYTASKAEVRPSSYIAMSDPPEITPRMPPPSILRIIMRRPWISRTTRLSGLAMFGGLPTRLGSGMSIGDLYCLVIDIAVS